MMNRNDAQDRLANKILAELSPVERVEMLKASRDTDLESPSVLLLGSDMVQWLRLDEDAPPEGKALEYLVRSLRASLYGVTNQYLQRELARRGIHVTVEGAQELLIHCVCCGYATIHNRGNYEVCPVCNWEDDGVLEVGRYSMPNHSTLGDGREAFRVNGPALGGEACTAQVKYPFIGLDGSHSATPFGH